MFEITSIKILILSLQKTVAVICLIVPNSKHVDDHSYYHLYFDQIGVTSILSH